MTPEHAEARQRPLRIAHVTGSFSPATYHGGPIASLHGLCRALSSTGTEVRVLTTNANGPARIEVPLDEEVPLDGMVVRYVHTITDRPFAPALLRRLPALVRWADVVHITGVYEHHTVPALVACRALERPVVWSPRGSLQRWERADHARAKTIWNAACRVVMPSRCTIHVTAKPEADASRARMPGVEIVTVPNGTDIPPDPPSAPPPCAEGDTFRLLFMGRLDPIKALDRLLDACCRLDGPWRLDVAGNGADNYTSTLKRQVAALGLDDQVTFLGHVSGRDKAKLITNAHALVLPSFSENFGMVIVEALACGRPVIASTGTPWAGLQHHNCGLWVDNSVDSLAAAIQSLRRRDLTEMGRRGRAWVERDYTWTGIARRMLLVYRAMTSTEPLNSALSHLDQSPKGNT